jgi:hypothetical protein
MERNVSTLQTEISTSCKMCFDKIRWLCLRERKDLTHDLFAIARKVYANFAFTLLFDDSDTENVFFSCNGCSNKGHIWEQ